jgi:hypothetical protein
MLVATCPGERNRQLSLVLEPVARQEPLKALAGVCGAGRFVGWRGRSGRRYVASRFSITDRGVLGFAGAVLLAVGGDGRVIAALAQDDMVDETAANGWRDAMAAAGAVELHLHLVAASASERAAAIADLGPRAH